MTNSSNNPFWVVIPASGIGARMQASLPKQYLKINDQAILQITINQMAKLNDLGINSIKGIVVAIAPHDNYFNSLNIDDHIQSCLGGDERVHSVLNALLHIQQQDNTNPWILVHDAARPCVDLNDIQKLMEHCTKTQQGGILANKVVDTLKLKQNNKVSTIDRSNIWQAQTPQCFRLNDLINAIQTGLRNNTLITDEASAMEAMGFEVALIEAKRSNIKITQPEDLALAQFFLGSKLQVK
ncbi:MAG: 2-C-methyl-D-erythritol 4-phosphate cytidylyltransferase [Saccharospirillaceae bacterium]|nr:2-C-methyl-D-erythritol 4-phosphate cytidylyltransferase [Pseudomonadales bacterium]NRB81703.1 2-C-methyl-D-erythritol 4-phosphate cytidylyltransferase [Saccharospirillaceae bacterium]